MDKASSSSTRLGFGFMRLPKIGTEFDMPLIEKMIDVFLANGNSYFDTAYIYQNSEETLRKTLVERYPRSAFQIATKLPVYAINENLSMQEIFQQSLTRLGVEYVDVYLLHGIDRLWAEASAEMGVWRFLKTLRDEGGASKIGFSFHGMPDELDYILENHPYVDVVQLQINYIDWNDAKIRSSELYDVARKHNKPIIVMEPVKGGLLASNNSPIAEFLTKENPSTSVASWAMRFVAQLDGVETILSGMNAMEQLLDNIDTLGKLVPLNESENESIAKAVAMLNSIPRIACTACSYCVEHCPMHIKIPQFISFVNEIAIYNSKANAQEMYDLYTGDGYYASTCIGCKKCEDHCPQKIEVSSIIKEVSNAFDGIGKI
jgi:predicted aldo/keto reductase-like oxidoreductase